MAPAGLSAVLRSRRTYPPASQGKLTPAALRGTCCYPWRSPTTSKHKYKQHLLRKAEGRRLKAKMQMSKYKNDQTTNWQKTKVDFFIFPLKPSSMLCFSEQYKISCQNILKCMGLDTEYCFPHFNPSR